jgi:hypothetical protein
MTEPPRKLVTQQVLDQTYNSPEWQERLARCRPEEKRNRPSPLTAGQSWGASTVVMRYWEAEIRIAVVIFYRNPDGSMGATGRPSCKGLLIEGVWHHS